MLQPVKGLRYVNMLRGCDSPLTSQVSGPGPGVMGMRNILVGYRSGLFSGTPYSRNHTKSLSRSKHSDHYCLDCTAWKSRYLCIRVK